MADFRVVKNKRISLLGGDDDYKSHKKYIGTLASDIQRIVNDFMSAWLRIHFEAGNHLLVREWAEQDRRWLYEPETRVGPRTRCPVDPCSTEMAQQLDEIMSATYPSMNKHCKLATEKALRILQKHGYKSAYPRWITVLLGRGGLLQSSQRSSIPFHKRDCRIIVPQSKNEDWKLEVNVDGYGLMTFIIKTKSYRLHSVRDMLWKIAAGEWDLKGLDLKERDGRLIAYPCHSIPKVKVPLDKNKTAFLLAAQRRPFSFRFNGKTIFRLRRGEDVEHTRNTLDIQESKKTRKYISAADKAKYERRWRDFIKTWSTHLANDVTRLLATNGIGHLVIFAPPADYYLEYAGRIGNTETTRWDWRQMQSLIQRACNKIDIDVTINR
jgi:uncharacterized protein YecT (DUF1311 family)